MKTREQLDREALVYGNAISAVADYIVFACTGLSDEEVANRLGEISAHVVNVIGKRAECLAADILFGESDPED